MKSALIEIGKELELGSITFAYQGDVIVVPLPDDFGTLEVSIWKDKEDSIQLLEGDFHTHGDILAIEYGVSREKAIRLLIEKIFDGELLLIEEYNEGQSPLKKIVETFEDYLKYLPDNVTYKVINKI